MSNPTHIITTIDVSKMVYVGIWVGITGLAERHRLELGLDYSRTGSHREPTRAK
jgi:hypothetical protein